MGLIQSSLFDLQSNRKEKKKKKKKKTYIS
jgi:hypothetical protein